MKRLEPVNPASLERRSGMTTAASLDLKDIARVDPRRVSSVYGPVDSWRVGRSLGIDLLLLNSICSFNCVYCQLGQIQVPTRTRRVFVPTRKVVSDLRQAGWSDCDIITFSGSGEPTLAANLGEVIRTVAAMTGKPILVLTNGSLLADPQVRRELSAADRVYVKLDAADEDVFARINRPVEGVDLEEIVEGAAAFRRQFKGLLGVQIMLLPPNQDQVEGLIPLLRRIQPEEVQVNTPTRPHASEWHLESRGSRGPAAYPAKPLKPLSARRIGLISRRLRQAAGLQVVSVFDRPLQGGDQR
ncbi:MAG TPA: radical SAM protein [Acidobacteriota bacterium]|nr:radical SAM protein [Acidobacteriota bacterium]